MGEFMKKDVKLYNVLFPLWMFYLLPQTWLIVLPGNFILDSLVLLIAMLLLKVEGKFEFYKSTILKVFLFGLLADIIGSVYMLFMMFVFEINPDGFYLTCPALVISAICIFIFNYYISFKKYDKRLRLKLALTFAVVTAPYTFLVPLNWLY